MTVATLFLLACLSLLAHQSTSTGIPSPTRDDEIRTLLQAILVSQKNFQNVVYEKLGALQSEMNELKANQNKPAACKTNIKPRCPTKYEEFNSSCYRIISADVNWWTAMQKCHEDGAHLASIESAAENKFLVEMISHTTSNGGKFRDNAGFWTGGHDQKSENVWIWESTGDRFSVGFTYTNWAPGEPNNDHDEDCMHIRIGQPTWNDEDCERKLNYICETSI